MKFFNLKNDYLNCWTDYTYPPIGGTPSFHIAIALSTLSAIVNRKYVLRAGHTDIYTNIWVVLIADSTIGRKSTILQTGSKLLREVWNMIEPDSFSEPPILPDEFTPEAFMKFIADKKSGTFIWSEYVRALITLGGRSYTPGFLNTLTEFYDVVPEFKRQIVSGSSPITVIKNPCFSISTGTTLEDFQDWFVDGGRKGGNAVHISNGFAQRFFYLTQDLNSEIFWGKTHLNSKAKAKLIDFLVNANINTKKSKNEDTPIEIVLHKEQEDCWKDWIKTLDIHNPQTEYVSYKGRIITGALKIASLLAISRGDVLISQDDIEDSLTICRMFISSLPRIFDVGVTQFQRERSKVVRLMQGKTPGEPIPMSYLLSEMNCYKFNMDRVIETMIARGELTRGDDNTVLLNIKKQNS